jgi:hypothetical protein
VRDLLAPWVDPEYDGPRAASGEPRWFVRDGGEIRFVPRGTPDAKSLTFIRSSVYDNPALLEKDPGYVATLKALPPVERARLLDGDWSVRRDGLVYPGFDGCVVESGDGPGGPVRPHLGGVDFGFHNAFAAVWGHLDGDDVLWITGVRYVRQTTIAVHAEAIPRGVSWWCDPAGAEPIAQLRHHGHEALPCVHRPVRAASGESKKPLLAGIDMVSERIRTGRLKIVRKACLPLVRELGMYHYDTDKHLEEPVKEDDHSVDALRYLVVGLDRHRSHVVLPESGGEPTGLDPREDIDHDRWWTGMP